MNFIADKQTLEDLNLLGKYKPHSIYSLFNQVKTAGGERALDEMFRSPLMDPEAINWRSSVFRYFQQKQLQFPFRPETFSRAENYLQMSSHGNLIIAYGSVMLKKIADHLLGGEQFQHISISLNVSIGILTSLKQFIDNLETEKDNPYKDELAIFSNFFADQRLKWLSEQRHTKALTTLQIVKYDYLLRHTLRNQIAQLLERIYYLDVYIAIADVARLRNFSYAKALPKALNKFSTEALRHPAIEKGIANPMHFDNGSNLLFLTGANMAGKSTLMKAFGIAVYLAHMGFPVAAKDMTFSVRDGIYSSINVPDNLNLGLSHFYAEVLRVKKVAEDVSSGKDLVVLFDELFKGTNVKDAYDGTLAVTEAFARYKNCFFIVSTHIIEVGDTLKRRATHIRLSYLTTLMEGTTPKYTYQLAPGISSDRQGMMIIQNEGILELIERYPSSGKVNQKIAPSPS